MKTTAKKTVSAAAESKTAAVSKAAKTPAKAEAKVTAKPAVEKKPAVKAEKPAAEKKTAKTTAKPAAAKTAAAKTAKKPAAKKTAAAKKTTTKAAAKTATKKPAKKAPVVNAETICAKLEKKISKSKAAAIKEKIAVDIEVHGFAEGNAQQWLYIEVDGGKVTVSPHNYNAKDFRISISFESAMAFVDGKITVKELTQLEPEKFYADGNIAKAVKLASIF